MTKDFTEVEVRFLLGLKDRKFFSIDPVNSHIIDETVESPEEIAEKEDFLEKFATKVVEFLGNYQFSKLLSGVSSTSKVLFKEAVEEIGFFDEELIFDSFREKALELDGDNTRVQEFSRIIQSVYKYANFCRKYNTGLFGEFF